MSAISTAIIGADSFFRKFGISRNGKQTDSKVGARLLLRPDIIVVLSPDSAVVEAVSRQETLLKQG